MLRDLEGYAAGARLVTSPLQLGEWLASTFGADIVERRRTRERAVAALEHGPPAILEVTDGVASAPSAAPSSASATNGTPPSSARPVPRQPPAAAGSKRRLMALGAVAAVVIALLAAVIAHTAHAVP
jgi:serine/threonine-protein kinase